MGVRLSPVTGKKPLFLKTITPFAFALAVICLCFSSARAETPNINQNPVNLPQYDTETQKEQDKRVYLEADKVTYDPQSETYHAFGDVEVYYQLRRLRAEEITYNGKTGVIVTKGRSDILDQNGKRAIFADNVTLSDTLAYAEADNLTFRAGKFIVARARTVKRVSKDKTEFNNAVFTACSFCPGESPLWQIRADKIIDNNEEKIVEYHDPTLLLFGVPTLSLPYFSYPRPDVKRKSGFLFPSVEIDTQDGVSVAVPYYFNLAQDQDLTVESRFYTENNPLLRTEYRRRTGTSSLDTELIGTVSETREINGVRENQNQFRGAIFAEGKTLLNHQNSGAGFNIQRATDDTFLTRYDFSETDFLQSRLYYEYSDQKTFIHAAGYAFQPVAFVSEPVSTGETPLVLPFIDYTRELSDDVYGGTLSMQGNLAALYRSEGIDTRRSVNKLHWKKEYDLPKGLNFTFENMLRADMYHTSPGNDPGDDQRKINGGFSGRIVPFTAGKIAAPFYKVTQSAAQKLEPAAQIVLAPYGGNPSGIPNEDGYAAAFDTLSLFDLQRFYGYDLIEGGPRLNLGVNYMIHSPINEFTGEARFGRSFRLKEDERFPAYSGLSGLQSDYTGRFVANYANYATLTADYRLDSKSGKMNMAGVNAEGGNDRLKLSLGYFKLRDYDKTSIFVPSERLATAARLKIAGNWWLLAGYRQDPDSQKTLETRGGILYADECINIELSGGRSFLRFRDLEPNSSVSLRLRVPNIGRDEFKTE